MEGFRGIVYVQSCWQVSQTTFAQRAIEFKLPADFRRKETTGETHDPCMRRMRKTPRFK